MSGMRVFMWYLCLQLQLHRLHCVALTRIFFVSQVFQYLNGTSLHLHIWQLAAGICFEGQSLCLWSELIRCADVCPILFSAFSVNTICAFHFSRLVFHSAPSVWHPPPSNPVCLLLFPPVPPLPVSFSILLSGASANLEHFAARADISEATYTFMFQAPVTATNMYILLSDSVRHVGSLLLFIWKLFNMWGLCVVETYSGLFLYHDSHFAGVDTLLYMNIEHILHSNSRTWVKAFIQTGAQKSKQYGGGGGGVSLYCCSKVYTIMATSWIDYVMFGCWILHNTVCSVIIMLQQWEVCLYAS